MQRARLKEGIFRELGLTRQQARPIHCTHAKKFLPSRPSFMARSRRATGLVLLVVALALATYFVDVDAAKKKKVCREGGAHMHRG